MEKILSDAISEITLRADKEESQVLFDTFVDVGPLISILSSNNNHVLYGRRGTGKTHVLEYLKNSLLQNGHCAIYLDLRTIGSNQCIYQDSSIPLEQRASKLVKDVASEINQGILNQFSISDNTNNERLEQVRLIVNEINELLSSTRIDGKVTSTETNENKSNDHLGVSFAAGLKETGINVQAKTKDERKAVQSIVRQGREIPYIHFPSVSSQYERIVRLLHGKRLIVIIDEFSELPLMLQPYLADMFRRSFFAIRGLNIKIGAIEHRTCLRIYPDASTCNSFTLVSTKNGRAKN